MRRLNAIKLFSHCYNFLSSLRYFVLFNCVRWTMMIPVDVDFSINKGLNNRLLSDSRRTTIIFVWFALLTCLCFESVSRSLSLWNDLVY